MRIYLTIAKFKSILNINNMFQQGTDEGRTRDLRFTRPTPYHLATAPISSLLLVEEKVLIDPWRKQNLLPCGESNPGHGGESAGS